MDDEGGWSFERNLWTVEADHYRLLIAEDCVMVVPSRPHGLLGEAAIGAPSDTPQWTDVEFTDGHIVRSQEGLIVVAYGADALRDGGSHYEAYCPSTYRRLGHEQCRVVPHPRTPLLKAKVEASAS